MIRKTPNDYDEMPMCPKTPMFFPRKMIPVPPTPAPMPTPMTLPRSTGSADFEFEPAPPIQKDINYTQGYLKTKIGKYVKIDFLIGSNMYVDKEGILEEVGISYVVLREAGTGNELMCDIYSIKFVTIFRDQAKAAICMD
ncbi:hypothetical protein SAMN02745883_00570 [Caminicella sporogenes DSM 14501]|uniref:Uncharacterized protein n=1 Tax=Caminicella sporogenes DSM 14501 TaxID=1121266 RepID=A0A1M6MJ92_9FIRM|nr:hypothetical protein [Caminicella sporogenes]RKD27529.1 hypothetical protein BET04_00200 [Caminicella sporogenes]WIF94896.1 hypothetical protein QNI18_11635 [Caminicella sporogenes]SHJ83440.1 hypothetical protein SAMN02745883_00570 [Caminicella sporogenes DSM 14501]